VAPVVDVELVISDCDGVLVDSEVISNRVLAAMLTEQGDLYRLESKARTRASASLKY
jgi:beta-phosphoglucomutase-like phosphatase (HAD superfamily)